jgi:secreted trypsin-like serine protease
MITAPQISSFSALRRPAALLAACAAAFAFVLALSSQPARASSGDLFETGSSLIPQGPAVPQIINGKESSISEFPWQVYVLLVYDENGKTGEASCGGSILSSTTILTAAHCTDHDGTNTPYNIPSKEALMAVFAGASKGLGFISSGTLHPEPATFQGDEVASVRRDPYFTTSPEVKDDVALLTLDKPLEISAARNTATISLVGAGDTPAPGTTLSISGYGKEVGAEGEDSNGNLYSTTLTAISSDACRKTAGEINSAVLLCAESATSATCQGDSGGPLTEGNPAVEVGAVDFGGKECPVGQPDVFTNLAAPEIRDFIEGSESPPVAARPTSPPVLKSVGSSPVDFGPMTCEPGGWNGSPTFTYTIQEENSSAAVLQSGSGNVFTPLSNLVNTQLVCIVQASNPGGVTTARSATTAAIAADTTPPSATLGALACNAHAQSCTLPFNATDPNGVALSEQSTAAYSVTTKCPPQKKKKKKKKHEKKTKPPVCHKTLTVPMTLSGGTGGAFQAAVSGLPYGETITFVVDVSNAAGVKAAPLSATTTLQKPKPKKKPKKKSKKNKKKH